MSKHFGKFIRLPKAAVDIIDSYYRNNLGISFNEYFRAIVILRALRISKTNFMSSEPLEKINLPTNDRKSSMQNFLEKENEFLSTNYTSYEDSQAAYKQLWDSL